VAPSRALKRLVPQRAETGYSLLPELAKGMHASRRRIRSYVRTVMQALFNIYGLREEFSATPGHYSPQRNLL
jgi:predicted transcriptional regulator